MEDISTINITSFQNVNFSLYSSAIVDTMYHRLLALLNDKLLTIKVLNF